MRRRNFLLQSSFVHPFAFESWTMGWTERQSIETNTKYLYHTVHLPTPSNSPNKRYRMLGVLEQQQQQSEKKCVCVFVYVLDVVSARRYHSFRNGKHLKNLNWILVHWTVFIPSSVYCRKMRWKFIILPYFSHPLSPSLFHSLNNVSFIPNIFPSSFSVHYNTSRILFKSHFSCGSRNV